MANAAVITYVRVSTSQQGRSGLGIEAQRRALQQFAKAEGLEPAREFVEVETGKGSDALDRRPQLKAALATARKHRATFEKGQLRKRISSLDDKIRAAKQRRRKLDTERPGCLEV
jgi:Resolvase, N terminal domain